MRKLRFLFLTAAVVALVGFVSCSKDPKGENQGIEDGVKTYARLQLTQSASATRAPAGTETPTADEKKVNNATIYMFKEPVKVLEKIIPLTVTAGEAESKVIEMTTGKYSFYTVINAPAGQITPTTFTENSTTLAQFGQKIINVASIADITGATDGFFITNVETPVVQNIAKATEAEVNDPVTPKNNFTFYVGRAMAKANVVFAPTTQSGGLLTDVKYLIRAQPNQMHLMPSYKNDVFFTPYHFRTPTAAQITSDYFENPGYSLTDGTAPSYMMENSNEVPLQGTSSYLLLQGTFTPTVTYDANGDNPLPGVVGDDFWRIIKADGSYEDEIYRAEPATGTAEEYEAGVCYYSFRIAKQELGTVNVAYDIKRNSYYYITITSVSGPGASDPDDPSIVNPEEPIVNETWIKAKIDHMDWTIVDQSGGI